MMLLLECHGTTGLGSLWAISSCSYWFHSHAGNFLLGHGSTYALLLYGAGKDLERELDFSDDVNLVYDTLTHHLISGVP